MNKSRLGARAKHNDRGQDALHDPMVQKTPTCLSRIVVFVQAVLGLMVSCLIWGWKLAPVLLYEAFSSSGKQGNIDQLTNIEQTDTQSVGGSDKSGWHKGVVVTCALGFYYFLFEIVVQPLVYTTNCCSNYAATVLVSIAVIVAHFVTGLAMHFFEERRQRACELEPDQKREEMVCDYRLENEMVQQQERMGESSLERIPAMTFCPSVDYDVHQPDEIPTKKRRWWPLIPGKRHT